MVAHMFSEPFSEACYYHWSICQYKFIYCFYFQKPEGRPTFAELIETLADVTEMG